MKRSVKRTLIILLVLIGLLAGYRLTVSIVNKIRASNKVEEARRVPVKAAMVRRTDLVNTLKFTGDIIGREVVNVFSQVPGKVESILVREGNYVGRGAIVFKINRDIVGMDFNLATVESPISGHVGKILVDRGMSVSTVTPLAQVVNMSTVEAVVRVMEENINRIVVGMPARITVESFPGEVFRGRVNKKSPVLDQISRTQEVRIGLDNPGMRLKHGMFANIEIVVCSRPNVVVLPSDAVMMDASGAAMAFVVEKDHAKKRDIKTGITVNDLTEVTEGLSEGEIVVTLGQENLSDGDSLVVYREDEGEGAETDKAVSRKGP